MAFPIQAAIQRLVSIVADIAFPNVCLVCGEPLGGSERHVCAECWKRLTPVTMDDTLYKQELNRLAKSSSHSALVCAYLFEKHRGMQELIHDVKYRGFTELGKELGRRVGAVAIERYVSADAVVPMPLHATRVRERGYNQADAVAEGIAEALGIPVYRNALERVRDTKSQTRLNIEERERNMKGAFKVPKEAVPLIKGKTVLLADDIITTGATMNAAGKALLRAGASAIIAASVALAGKDSPGKR